VNAAVRPAVSDPNVAGASCDYDGAGRVALVRHHAQDARGEPAQLVLVELIGPAEVVDHLRDRVAARWVPDVLGELVVADLAAIGVPPLGDAKVHVYPIATLGTGCQSVGDLSCA
jgi:hypothetical protein